MDSYGQIKRIVVPRERKVIISGFLQWNKILEIVRTETGTGRLYFWGSSMGGYVSTTLWQQATCHGCVRERTTNPPMLGSQYSNNGMKNIFRL